MRLFLIGFGTVGQSLLELLRQRAEDLQARYGFSPVLVAVYTRSQGLLYAPEGLNLAQLQLAPRTTPSTTGRACTTLSPTSSAPCVNTPTTC